jgi:hypothetical protein
MATKLKLQQDSWQFASPGGFEPINTVMGPVLESISSIANQGDGKAIYDHFLKHFGHTPLTDYIYARPAAKNVLEAAAKANGALFVRSFVYACDQLRERGVSVPDRHWTLALWAKRKTGFGVKHGTIVKYDGHLDLMMAELTADKDAREVVTAPVVASARRKLRVFLCHAKEDKPAVWALHARLTKDGFDPWLDRVNLLPGEAWEAVIGKALRECDIVLICLSPVALTKRGFVQQEVRVAQSVANEYPPGVTFLIPVRLQDCELPDSIAGLHAVNLFEDEEENYQSLVAALRKRAATLSVPRQAGSSATPI